METYKSLTEGTQHRGTAPWNHDLPDLY